MGLVRTTVTFPGEAPTIPAILAGLRQRTGLDVEWTGQAFRHAEFRDELELERAPGELRILAPLARRSYLYWTLVATLVELGGRHAGAPPPAFATQRWRDRRWWQRWPR
jgi:hypothetical protein